VIIYFVTRGYEDTIEVFLDDWSPAARERFLVVSYEDTGSMATLPAGAAIFSDIERLGPSERKIAGRLREAFAAQFPGHVILNDPLRTMRRYDLLATLADRGLNPFRAYRLTETIHPRRFPVFLRYENEHTGSISGLLGSQDELEGAIVRAIVRGHDLHELLIVEYVDASDGHGRFSKYAAAVVGDRIIPRHIMSSENWIVKGSDSLNRVGPDELEYIRVNPHGSQIAAICSIAGVEYGRIDYTVIDDRVVTWEINTNPYLVYGRDDTPPRSLPRLETCLPLMEEAFAAIDPGPTNRRIDISDIAWTKPTRSARSTKRSVVTHLRRYQRVLSPTVRVVTAIAIWLRRPILAGWSRINGISE